MSHQKKTGTLISGFNDGAYAMPAVGSSSTNLSLSDVALDVGDAVGRLRTTGLLVDVTTLGLLEPVTFGFGVKGFRITAFSTLSRRWCYCFFLNSTAAFATFNHDLAVLRIDIDTCLLDAICCLCWSRK
jgi:hypothetical protein